MICSSVNLLFLMSAIFLKSGPRLIYVGTARGEQVIGTSAGTTIAPFDSDHPKVLTQCADRSLYRANSDGCGMLDSFEHQMNCVMRERCRMKRGEFDLVYQPQALLDTVEVRVLAP